MFFRKDNKKRSPRNKKRQGSNKKKLFPKKYKYLQSKKVSPILSALLIFSGFISLSLAIFMFIRQINPLIKNERLKYLCTYELGNKKNEFYEEKIIKLKNLVGDSKKFCRDFIFPRDHRKSKINFIPFLKDIFFRIIF